MPSTETPLEQIKKDAAIAKRILDEATLPQDKISLKEYVLEDFTHLRRLVQHVLEDAHSCNEIRLLANQLLMAVHSLTEIAPEGRQTELLEREEIVVRRKIKQIFGFSD